VAPVVVRDEAEAREHFDQRYGGAVVPALVEAELAACGSDYGGNGYTTRDQADLLGVLLGLSTGQLLLDVGSGCGWPGVYLADTTGCSVVVSDLPMPGMRRARSRAAADGLAARTSAVVASARHLPFRPDCFDAVVHTDVLC
jgi:SAM-dependent methyltransferase